jgi:hypothetical protein
VAFRRKWSDQEDTGYWIRHFVKHGVKVGAGDIEVSSAFQYTPIAMVLSLHFIPAPAKN